MTDVQNKAPEKKEDRRVRRTKKLLSQGLIQLMQEKQVKDITVRDASLLDMGALLSLPHKGLVVQGTRVQLVCGLHAAQLRHVLEQQLAEMAPV